MVRKQIKTEEENVVKIVSKEKGQNTMLDVIKKLFVLLLLAGNIYLGIMYARTEAQYTMYKQFTEAQMGKITLHEVPNSLPMLK